MILSQSVDRRGAVANLKGFRRLVQLDTVYSTVISAYMHFSMYYFNFFKTITVRVVHSVQIVCTVGLVNNRMA